MEPVSVVHVPQVHLDDKLSKAEILRGLITEKLTTAAQEIFAVVKRTVAGYEEEVSGLKQEIERQRRQLEVVLQPQVTLCRIGEHGLISLCEEENAGGGRVTEEQQQRQQMHVEEAAGSQYVSGHTEKKDLGSTEDQSTRIDQEDLRAPDHQIPKTGGRSEITTFRICDPLRLRVCLLNDLKSNKLKKGMFTSPTWNIKCPRAMKEADFLDRLRSTFPQLTGPFDAFTTDASRILTPLKVKTLTPEEIYKSIKSTGKGRSALYIRAKSATQQLTCENERKHEATTDSPSTSATKSDETGTYRSASSDPVESAKTDAASGSSRAQQMEAKNADDGDSLPDVPDPTSDSPAPPPVPSGNHSDSDCTEDEQTDDSEQSLTESKSDSSNPNLKRTFLPFPVSSVADSAGDTSDSNRKQDERSNDWKSGDGDEPVSSNIKTPISLQKTLRVCLLKNIHISVLKYGNQQGVISSCENEGAGGSKVTKEEDQQRQRKHVDDTTKSRDVSGHTEEEESGDEEDAGSAEMPAQSTSLDQGELKVADQRHPRRRQRFRIIRVCLFKKSNCDKLKGAVFRSRIRKVACHRGMKEADFLKRLRLTFPQLTGQTIEAFTTDTSRKLTPLKVKTLTPEEIYKSIKSTGKGRSALYIRVKKTCQIKSKHEATRDSPFTSAITAKPISVHSAADREENDTDSDCTEDGQTDDDDIKLYSRRFRTLRVCLLKDMQTNVVKTGVLMSPIQRVKCHRGMKEADFLNQLRSIFPRLTGPFDVFKTDTSKRLTPLKVKTLTPEEIYKSIKSSGKGRSALYIRAKSADQQRICEKQLCPQKRQHEATTESLSTSATTSSETGEHRSDPVERVEGRETDAVSSNSRPQQMETEDGGDGDKDLPDLPEPTTDSLEPSPGHSAAGREGNHSDNDCTKDRQTDSDQGVMESQTGSLSPVRQSKWSLRRSIRSRSPAHNKGDSSDSDMDDDDTDDDWEPDEEDESLISAKKPLQLRVGLLMDTDTNVHTENAYKYSVQTVWCPRGMQEDSFVHHLRSTFPHLTRPFETFTTDASRKLLPLKLSTLTPEEICKSIKSTGKGRSALYIQLKKSSSPAQSNDNTTAGTSATRNDENMPHASSHNITVVEEKSSKAELQSNDSRLQQQMETEKDQGGGDCEISEPQDVGAPSSVSSAPESKDSSSDDEVEERDTDIDWKPDEEEGESEPDLNSSETMRKQQVKQSGIKTKQRKRLRIKRIVSCKICGSLRSSVNSLVKHVWTHVDNPERLCGVCGEHSESAEELKNHIHGHLKTHICNICGKHFVSVAGLNKHAIIHTGQRKYKCDICLKTYTCSNYLKLHQRAVHMEKKSQNKPHICKVCGKSFDSLRSLSVHNFMHTGQKYYTCQICGKRFITLGRLKAHETIHTVRQKTHLCHICCKTFYSRCGLNAHLKTHSDEKTLCSECGKELSSVNSLRRHMIIHRNERPFSCSECGQAFNSWSTLRFHMRTHTGEKRFVCSICGKATTRREHLTIHMRTHNGERPYQCTLCEKAFTQSHCLKTHMRSHQVEKRPAVSQVL